MSESFTSTSNSCHELTLMACHFICPPSDLLTLPSPALPCSALPRLPSVSPTPQSSQVENVSGIFEVRLAAKSNRKAAMPSVLTPWPSA